MSNIFFIDHELFNVQLICICDIRCWEYQYYLEYPDMVSYQEDNTRNKKYHRIQHTPGHNIPMEKKLDAIRERTI